MLGSLLRRLTGQRAEPPRPAPIPPAIAETQTDAAPPAEQPAEPDLQMSSLEAHAIPGGPGKSPVFSSRAVRDATVVTGTIESLNRFVTGQDVLDDLTWRLESLTADQVNFLQLSAEPGLIQRAQARSEILKGAKAAALRKLLTDLAGGAIPEPASRSAPLVPPNAPILPPLTSLLPRAGEGSMPSVSGLAVPSLGSANPAPPGPSAPSLTTAPPLVSKPIPPAPAKPLVPTPVPPKATVVSAPALADGKATEPKPAETKPVEVKSPEAKAPEPKPAALKLPDVKPVEPKPAEPAPAPTLKVPEPVAAAPKTPAPTPAAAVTTAAVEPRRPEPAPEPAKVQAEPTRPAQAPVAPPPEPAGLPRLDRQDAEARRARLLASLTDTFSSSEAAP
ncbi:MAG: hypothetical protein ACT6Q8_18275 [Niveispirillum sp.]|uniref:hypothetical protein n=1 Tax=Niveispirillum sp. TaxID=1917217 RepID=UPI0040352EDC